MLAIAIALCGVAAAAHAEPAAASFVSRREPARFDPRHPGFFKLRTTAARPLIVGSAALDTIYTPTNVKHDRVLGGSAVYAAVAAAKTTAPTVVAPIGRDFPARYVQLLERQGVDTSGLARSNGLSFAWTGRYVNSKDRVTEKTELGVLGDFRPQLPAGARPRYVFLANMAPEQQLQVLRQLGPARGKGRPFIVADTMNLWIEGHRPALQRVIRRADVLLLNDEEAPLLGGAKDLRAAAANVLGMGPKMVIVKQGKHGATLYYRQGAERALRSFSVPVYPVAVKDTTGAGDSFGGALLSYLARADARTPRAVGLGMVYAAAIASSTVESFGLTRLGRLAPAEIARRFDHLARQVDLAALGSE